MESHKNSVYEDIKAQRDVLLEQLCAISGGSGTETKRLSEIVDITILLHQLADIMGVTYKELLDEPVAGKVSSCDDLPALLVSMRKSILAKRRI